MRWPKPAGVPTPLWIAGAIDWCVRSSSEGTFGWGRVILGTYGVALLQVLVVFTVGEPYPFLQGPLFAGHLQEARTIRVLVYRGGDGDERIPGYETLLWHETLGLRAQGGFEELAPNLKGTAAREYLIGHSVRLHWESMDGGKEIGRGNWTTLKFHAPWDGPPVLEGEEDVIDD